MAARIKFTPPFRHSIARQFIENIYLTGAGNLAATGNNLANGIVGDSGNNVLNGGTEAATTSLAERVTTSSRSILP